MAHIDRLNNKVASMVPSEESLAVVQQHQGLTRELEYIQPNEESHDNNPWATSNQDQWSSNQRSIDLYEDTANDDGRKNVWELDTAAKTCRVCVRKFGFLSRRHHCRKCGLVVCDKCSPWKVFLNSSDILQDPEGTLESLSVLASQQQRVCEKCYFHQEHNNN